MRVMVVLWLCAGCGRIGFGARDGDPTEAGSPIVTSDAFDTSDALGNLAVANVVFVTSTTYVVGSFGGVAAADQACNTRAQAAGLPGTFVAWLSSTTSDAKTRLGNARGWVRRDGLPFTDTVADLFAGRLFYAPVLDEYGAVLSGTVTVATGTYADGTVDSAYNCTDYTTGAGNRRLRSGYAESGTQAWTFTLSGAFCNMPYRIYCFQNDRNFAITKPTGTTRKAFVSSGIVAPTAGVATADAQCASDAVAAGLPGSFAALLAGDGTIAASRFPVGVPWSRIDGAVVTSDFTEQLAALNVTAVGTYIDDTYAWVGAPAPNLPGSAATTCANWTSNSSGDHGDIGLTGRTTDEGLFGVPDVCNTTGYRVYCFQK